MNPKYDMTLVSYTVRDLPVEIELYYGRTTASESDDGWAEDLGIGECGIGVTGFRARI